MTEKTSTGDAPNTTPGNQLPKAYDPSTIEHRWAEYWVSERLFDVATPATNAGAPSKLRVGGNESNAFTILLPPPNVTGRLHMGHMLNQTEMDILTRWHRMRGETSLWVPGTDHAGIATQMMVERQLASEGTNRKTLGREAFTERVWDWKHQYGSAITDQMRRLGASVDWSREYFTMDDRLSVAVKEAFVRLYEQGLIYRGAYIVNWDPVQQTAVSDLEVIHEERAGKLYHIRYPFADETGSIVVATTRPETMLGDVAVAVNPNDERYKHLIGKSLRLPLSGINGQPHREIPILADDWAQPEFGTGAVKVTPAHDPNDFAIGQRHNLPSPIIMDETAHIDLPGSPYHGLDRYAAREKVLADLEVAGLLVDMKDHTLAIAVSQRSGAVIEPRLSMQWFLAVNKAPQTPGAPSFREAEGGDAGAPGLDSETWDSTNVRRNSIAQNAIDAVRDGHIKFTPEMYSKTYMEWMNNIHDWCISRQLWWGHRIPAWHCNACGKITVSRDVATACSGCGITDIQQSTDVLDTWFSSGLLPFTVFGWPGSSSTENGQRTTDNVLTPDLAAFYPTTLLVTGFDILFFWVARMIMLGCHFMLDVPMPDGSPRTLAESVPFREVYIHGLVRDANREKMSKTKGNVINPIEIIERFGTDAVRFTLASQASPGTDIAFNEARTEGYRAFANKIWNAARFLFMNLDRAREAGIEVDLRQIGRYRNGGLTPMVNDIRQPGEPPAMIPSWSTQIYLNETVESRWIRSRLAEVAKFANQALRRYRFDEAAEAIYQFVWGDFCDWYLEIVKIRLDFDGAVEPAQTAHAINMLVATFDAILRLLSPFMPFLTEELWHALYAAEPPKKSIALTRYPEEIDFLDNYDIGSAMEVLQTAVTIVRTLRKERAVPEKESIPLDIRCGPGEKQILKDNAPIIRRLARVSTISFSAWALSDTELASGAKHVYWGDIRIVYERQIDVAAERERLTKELAKHNKTLAGNEARLADEKFIGKAPAHIVEGLRKQTDELRILRDKAQSALDVLPSE